MARYTLTLVAAAALVAAVPAAADVFIRLPTEIASPRSAGLGGATAALGGDAAAFAGNPASLVSIPRTLDATVAGGNKGGCTLAVSTHPLSTLAAGLILPCVAVPTADNRLALVPLPGTTVDPLRPRDGRWLALGGAWMPDRRLSVGGLVQLETLELLGDGGDSEAQRFAGWSVGAFVQPDSADGTRVAFAYRRGFDRTFAGEDAGTLPPVTDGRRVRRPDVYSFGVSWRYAWLRNTRIVVSVQPEVIRYADIVGDASANELDLRAGAEAWFPFGPCVSGCGGMWQLRVGVISRSAIPSFARTFTDRFDPGRRSTTLAGGVSLAPAWRGGKFKGDLSYSHESESWLAGIAFRFPSAFRGDLRHHRRR